MMKIPESILEAIYEQGAIELPNEACGYLAGKNGLVTKRYPMRNVDESPEHFTLDPKEQFQVIKQVRAEGLDVVAIYHTHPETPARPSEEDSRLAFDPRIQYVIASLIPGQKQIKSFLIQNGEVKPQTLEII